MKVLIAADYSSPYGGNFLGSLLDLGDAMRLRGDELVFLFPARQEGERFWVSHIRNLGYKVFLIDMARNDEAILQDISRIIIEQNIDIIHSHFGMLHHFFLFEKKRLGNVKLLLHDHMGFSYEQSLKTQMQKNRLRSLLFLKNRIGVISVMKQKDASYALNVGRHWYVPNGISFRRCISASMSRRDRRIEKGISDQTKLVLVFGWNFEIKGIDIAVRGVQEARQTDSSIELAVVIQDEQPTAEQLVFLTSNTGLDPLDTPWLHFWPGNEDVYSYHRAADLFLSSSRTEAFPYGVLEAISEKRTIVMSNIEGTRWANAYHCAEAYPVADSSACAEAILRGLAEKRTPNSNSIVEQYSIERWVHAVMHIYDSL